VAVKPHTGRRRAQRMFPEIRQCERCGDGTKLLDRHHVDGNTFNNARKNVRFLCRRCHMIEDGRLAAFAAAASKRAPMVTAAAAKARRARTICKRGHPLSGVNLYVKPNGNRICRTCRRALARREKGKN
jgi:hypothetical protein